MMISPAKVAPASASYLQAVADFYDAIAQAPALGLCCVTSNVLHLPDLRVPTQMAEMSYGCGTTVHPDELTGQPSVLYIGVGAGLEALQFAYFSRRAGAVIAVDPASAMRQIAQTHLIEAAQLNTWFDPSFVQIMDGDALRLPIPDASVDFVAQNCLFNVFKHDELRLALSEAARVLKPSGRLMMSDPIATREIPEHLKADDRLHAMCLNAALHKHTAKIVN